MIAFVVVLVSIFGLTHGSDGHWSYEPNNMAAWPGVCKTGRRQSPIAIDTFLTVFNRWVTREPLRFRGYPSVTVSGINNGHTVEWRFEGDTPPVLSGGPFGRNTYNFRQFHVHWDSEHEINNKLFHLEIHMVHVKNGLTFEQALTQEDGLAVVGVMCNYDHGAQTALTDAPLAQIMQDVSMLSVKTKERLPAINLNLTRLFSPEPQAYYTYNGSLTTPPCSEAVTWIVMPEPLLISRDHYDALTQHVKLDYKANYRNLQDVNERMVFRSFEHNVASCSSLANPGLIALVVLTLNDFASKISWLVNKGKRFMNTVSQKVTTGLWNDCTKVLN